ncbi:BRO-N domain-containing protein [Pelosinus propionicus]|uniref:Prophage antirepressor n=1 Tax=Pelosinus propionicus DSM 13327 TaxID=1123291 RepID=A0A1I4N8D4_9FIRM|nr:BRO family protein [Pelosinus propionicus]SFM11530.1 Prophage antirepressor [Pelosinus propionicus DSM 13327]
MNKQRIENWNGFNIRFIEKEIGDWWAVANDIAHALGYRDSFNMTRILEHSEKDTLNVSTLGGVQTMAIVSEIGIYDAVFNSRKSEAKNFKRWVYEIIKNIRTASGLEGFQIFTMLDKTHQREAMTKLRDGLTIPTRINFIKANTIANKAVSTINGYGKMLKKGDMYPEMLIQRQAILDKTVELMTVKEEFGLEVSVSKLINNKFVNRGVEHG